MFLSLIYYKLPEGSGPFPEVLLTRAFSKETCLPWNSWRPAQAATFWQLRSTTRLFPGSEKQSPSHCLPAKWIGAFLIIAGEWTVEGSSYTESKQKWGGGQSCNGGFLRSQNDFCKIQSAVIFNVRARRAREKFPYSTPSLILKIIRFFSY